MAGDEEMKEGSISSLIIESLESNQNGDALSPEDLAWVDSCLIKDPESSDSNWNALKDVLLEIVSSEPEAPSHSEAGSFISPKESEIDMDTSIKDAEFAQFPGSNDDYDVVPILVDSGTDNDSYYIKQNNSISLSEIFENDDDGVVPTHVESEKKSKSNPIKKKNGISLSEILESDDIIETFKGDPFLPSYKEGKEDDRSEAIGSELDLGPLAVELEPFSLDIFKVWDLGVSDEEDELGKLLNKALEETSIQSTPLVFDESDTGKNLNEDSIDNLNEDSIDNLIAGIADLSLDKSFR